MTFRLWRCFIVDAWCCCDYLFLFYFCSDDLFVVFLLLMLVVVVIICFLIFVVMICLLFLWRWFVCYFCGDDLFVVASGGSQSLCFASQLWPVSLHLPSWYLLLDIFIWNSQNFSQIVCRHDICHKYHKQCLCILISTVGKISYSEQISTYCILKIFLLLLVWLVRNVYILQEQWDFLKCLWI